MKKICLQIFFMWEEPSAKETETPLADLPRSGILPKDNVLRMECLET